LFRHPTLCFAVVAAAQATCAAFKASDFVKLATQVGGEVGTVTSLDWAQDSRARTGPTTALQRARRYPVSQRSSRAWSVGRAGVERVGCCLTFSNQTFVSKKQRLVVIYS